MDWQAHDTALAAEPNPFVAFRERYFNRPTAPHHWQMIRAIEAAEPGSNTLILAFPMAAKTSVLVDYACWLLGPKDPDFRVCVISAGQDLSRKIVAQVKTRMTDEAQFADYIGAFGPFRPPDRSTPRPWNADFLQTMRSSRDEKEPSLESKGWTGRIYGGRYDLIVVDDIQDQETLSSTHKLMDYYRGTLRNRLDISTGRIVFIGSRVGTDDIYERLIAEGIIDNLVRIPALDKPCSRDEHFEVRGRRVFVNPECESRPTWDFFSMADLAKIRKDIGEERWARTYMQSDASIGGAAFSPEVIASAADESRGLGLTNASGGRVGLETVCAIDPALDNGTCALVAASWSPEHLALIDAVELTGLYNNEAIMEAMAGWSATYKPSRWIVEQNAHQRSLVRDTRLVELAERNNFDIVSHNTGRNKNDPVLGVASMAMSMADAEISWPSGTLESRERFARWRTELAEWKPVATRYLKQDLVMATWFIWLAWENEFKRSGVGEIPRLWAPTWLAESA